VRASLVRAGSSTYSTDDADQSEMGQIESSFVRPGNQECRLIAQAGTMAWHPVIHPDCWSDVPDGQ
jgi:hypothetical protein